MLNKVRIAVQILPVHKAALARLARAEDISPAAMVRRLIRAEAERRHVWLDGPQTTVQTARVCEPPEG